MWFYWWNDAVDEAQTLATATGIRHKVSASAGLGWEVDLADDAVLLEVCS